MKQLVAFLFILTMGLKGFSQADPGIISIQSVPATLGLNSTGFVEITEANFGSNDIVANSVRILLTISSNATITGVDASSDPKWSVFSLGSGAANSIQLRNNATIASGDGGVIKLAIKAVATGGPSTFTGNIAYYFTAGGNPLLTPAGTQSSSQGNDNTNDNGQSTLTVTVVVPLRLTDVTAEPSDCSAKLKWSTSMEEAGADFDVEYSADGRNYVKVATVAGHNIATGSSYEYAYNQGNGKGYYRLRMGNADGGYTYSKVVNTNIKCNVKKVFIYPNPLKADEVLHVNVSNFEGKVRGELLGAEGKVILTRTLQNGSNLVMLGTLPQGNYSFKVSDDKGEMQNYKVVIVK